MALPVVRSAFCKSGITELLRDCYGIKRPMQNAGAGRGQFRWVNGKAKLGFKLQKLPFKRGAVRDTLREDRAEEQTSELQSHISPPLPTPRPPVLRAGGNLDGKTVRRSAASNCKGSRSNASRFATRSAS